MKEWAAKRWRRAPQASWRAVPRVDLLEGGGGGRGVVVRAGLALLLLGGLYLLYSVYQEGTTLQRGLEGASRRLKATQATQAALASRGDEVSGLEAELAALRERSQAAARLDQQLGGERWQAALAALEGLQGDGVSFQSLKGSAGGDLTVVAVAAGGQPLARLQRRLQETGHPFELQGVQWKQDTGALTLTATLRVKASP